ncbi:SGNH/GDSL hydrolase family protein [Oceanihabitans sp. 2_MG-2023]|uniref:SGNH/GDSL hydrolase family protein n=1 Tax=Oceanihabitans sp. 2_MG-2023 TaxID=3062661 RepID=UPI0026E35FD0|nr:SGNH/GDSL hydrolase family protein [Oceanihabitans sp. 2_MG-2023]MDO6596410.1 SGNH/GDSL hydrolase family protein [Oceanihabitans sp. 2_MG-2023]
MKYITIPSFKKLAFMGLVFIILLIIAEIVLSWLKIFPDDYYTMTPNSGFTWTITPNEIIGIQGDSEIAFDAIGARSISNLEDKKNKIVVFGGSTTACFALTQQLTWPALLEKKLGDTYWVGNFGRPGNSSNHHTLQFKHILEKPELKEVKTVLIMQGVNDFVGSLVSKERYINSDTKTLTKFAFQHTPEDHLPFHKKLTLYKLAVSAKNKIKFQLKHKEHLTKAVASITNLRHNAELTNELPDVTESLNHYEKNTLELIRLAKAKGIHLIFIQQATMWKPDLEEEYEKLLLTSGFENNNGFYSTTALYHGMEIFNEKLKNICKQNNVEFIDLDLPKTTESFYDDFHFNESGARLVSDRVFTALTTKGLLK